MCTDLIPFNSWATLRGFQTDKRSCCFPIYDPKQAPAVWVSATHPINPPFHPYPLHTCASLEMCCSCPCGFLEVIGRSSSKPYKPNLNWHLGSHRAGWTGMNLASDWLKTCTAAKRKGSWESDLGLWCSVSKKLPPARHCFFHRNCPIGRKGCPDIKRFETSLEVHSAAGWSQAVSQIGSSFIKQKTMFPIIFVWKH